MRKKRNMAWLAAALWGMTGVIFLSGAARQTGSAQEDIQVQQMSSTQGENGQTEQPQTDGMASEEDCGLPVRWYAGDYGKKPVVRDQGKYGTCWALSAASAMEASLLPDDPIVFSADHLSLANAFTARTEDGGDYLMLMAYLSGWQGPVTEEEDPYGDEYSPPGLLPAVHVQEVRVLEYGDTNEIKKWVQEYGAVQTSLYMDRNTTSSDSLYYNQDKSAYYYYGSEIRNHDVVILGWDDTYSRFHFQTPPAQDGAFICQNTWGEAFGENGIFYVSYADSNVGDTVISYSRIEGTDNYARIYQTDDCGWQGKQGYDDDTCWFANVYTAVSDEWLSAVGLYATAPEASCEIYYVPDFAGPESFGKKEFLKTCEMDAKGYYTIDLETPVALSAGERFAVVVRMTTSGEWNPVAVEYKSDEYTQNVTIEGKEGYLSQTGDYWQNTEEEFGTNVCLKAYTNDPSYSEGNRE